MKIIPDITGLLFRKKFPMKNPNKTFKIITQNFVFLPLEKIRKTTAAIQKNAMRIATINCL